MPIQVYWESHAHNFLFIFLSWTARGKYWIKISRLDLEFSIKTRGRSHAIWSFWYHHWVSNYCSFLSLSLFFFYFILVSSCFHYFSAALQRLDKFLEECKESKDSIHSALANLSSLEIQYKRVSEQTDGLRSLCETVMKEKVRRITLIF